MNTLGGRDLKLIKLFDIALIFAALVLPMLLISPAVATSAPDSTPFVDNIHVFQHLLEPDDALFTGEYHIPYAVLPSEMADDTYMFVLIDDSGNQTGFAVPYCYFDRGYNLGVFSMYFPAGIITWSDNYTIRIAQNPANFASPQTYDYVIDSSAYCPGDTTDENRAELYSRVIEFAGDMETEYDTYTFTEPALYGTVLYSPTGENYFRNAIFGIQSMCPDLFLYQVLQNDDGDIPEYTDNQSQEYEHRYDGTAIGDDMEDTADQFGMSGTGIMAFIFALPVCLGFIIASAKKFHKTEPGFLTASLVLLVAYMMGWMPAAIFATMYQTMGIYLAYVVFYARG
jgi:hypothetical protein